MPKPPTKAELQERLARAERQNGAYSEWFRSVEREDEEQEMSFVDHDDNPDFSVTMRVRIRAVYRMCGGVAAVKVVGSDLPARLEYLDDLISRWLDSRSPYVREAACKLMRLREETHNVKAS